MNPGDLENIWSSLSPSTVYGELAGVRAPNMPAQAGVWIARDEAGRSHLIVELPQNVEPLVQRTTEGLEVATRELRIGGRSPTTYIDLFCVELAHQKTFTAVACDIANAIVVSPLDPRGAVVRSLERWRSFWAADPLGLSREEALGLFGELWFMLRWIGPVTKTTVESWQDPLGARHDFQRQMALIEVKAATASSRGVVHEISKTWINSTILKPAHSICLVFKWPMMRLQQTRYQSSSSAFIRTFWKTRTLSASSVRGWPVRDTIQFTSNDTRGSSALFERNYTELRVPFRD